MSELGETFATLKAGKALLRRKFGRECPECKRLRPRTNASILLPGQKCWLDGYRDSRKRTTRAERNEAYAAAGLDLVEMD